MLLVSYHPCMVSFVRIIYPMGDIGVRDQCAFSMFIFTMCSTILFFMNLHFFISVVCMWCLTTVVVSLHINQSICNLEALLFSKRTNVSMPHGKNQLMFMYHGLNVAFVKTPPSTNLQQDIVCIHKLLCKYCISLYHI